MIWGGLDHPDAGGGRDTGASGDREVVRSAQLAMRAYAHLGLHAPLEHRRHRSLLF